MSIQDLKASIEKFIADVEAYKQTVKAAVAKAVSQDEGDDGVDVQALQDTVDTADAALIAPDVETASS